MSEHTELPWSTHFVSATGLWEVLSAESEIVAKCNTYAQSALIVQAVNARKDLLAACQGLADAFPESDAGDLDAADFKDRAALTFIAVRKAKAALAKAKE